MSTCPVVRRRPSRCSTGCCRSRIRARTSAVQANGPNPPRRATDTVTRAHAATLIGERFGSAQVQGDAPFVVTVPVDQWQPFAEFAKNELGCHFFSFSTAVDWKEQGLEIVARVDTLDEGISMVMKTRLAPGVSECASLVPVYRGANWMERECFDMFGFRFA